MLEPPLTSQILRARVADLALGLGLSPSGLALQMGRSHTWLKRKLAEEGPAARALTTEDLDEIETHLDLPPGSLLQPVLLDGDLQALRRIAQPPGSPLLPASDASDLPLERLLRQGLIYYAGEQIGLSGLGLQALSHPQIFRGRGGES